MSGTPAGAAGRPAAIRCVARLVVEDRGLLLLARDRGAGHLFLPGGGIEPGESAARAAARELEEETGIAPARLGVLGPLGVLEHSWIEGGQAMHHIDVVLRATVVGLRAGDPVPSRESHLEFRWLSADDLARADFHPRALRDALPGWRRRAPAAFASDMAAAPR